jgi:hypothetical protein
MYSIHFSDSMPHGIVEKLRAIDSLSGSHQKEEGEHSASFLLFQVAGEIAEPYCSSG